LPRNATPCIEGIAISSIANEEVCFQPGIGTKDIVIYEIWSCLPLDSAAKETRD